MTGSDPVDGIFSGGTLHGVGGVVGPNTWAALDYRTAAPDYVC